MLKRRKKKKTNYRQRLGMIKSKKPRLVVRRTLKNIHAQIINYDTYGDKTIIEVSSKNLKKYGWKSHCGNLPSAYLCGLLIGLKAAKKDIDEVVLDIGLQTSRKAASIYATAMAVRDTGTKINLDQKMLPDMGRISGQHISEYAKSLKPDKERYSKQFSQYIKNGIDPEKLPEHFEEVKKKILEEFGFKMTEFKKEVPKDETKKEKNVAEKTDTSIKETIEEVEEGSEAAEDKSESSDTSEEEWEDVE